MGITGSGLKANGLHKVFSNGSQEDNNASQGAKATRTGGNVTAAGLRADGMHKSYISGSPEESNHPFRQPSKPLKIGTKGE